MKALPALVLSCGVFVASGCSSVSQPAVNVRARTNHEAPAREAPAYFLMSSSADVQKKLTANPVVLGALREKLASLGYVRASTPDKATYLVSVENGAADQRVLTVTRPMTAVNPNSVRYKNLAAMTGDGRYREVLEHQPDDPGDVLIGPGGETVGTGRWQRLAEDPEAELPGTEVRSQRMEYLLLQAWDVSDVAASRDVHLVWEVIATQAAPREGSAFAALLESATKKIGTE